MIGSLSNIIHDWKISARLSNMGSGIKYYDVESPIPITFGVGTSFLALKDAKTKALVGTLNKLGFGKTALVIDGEAVETGFARATANIPGVDVLPAIGANVYDILRHDTLVLTRAGVEKLEARFNG